MKNAIQYLILILLLMGLMACQKPVDPTTPVLSISFHESQVQLAVGSTQSLHIAFNPINATYRNLTWSSSNPSVADVDKQGRIIAHSEGSTTITAEHLAHNRYDRTTSTSCSIHVIRQNEDNTDVISSIEVRNFPAYLPLDAEPYQLIATVFPVGIQYDEVKWAIEGDKNIATIDNNGVIRVGNKIGKVNVKVYHEPVNSSDRFYSRTYVLNVVENNNPDPDVDPDPNPNPSIVVPIELIEIENVPTSPLEVKGPSWQLAVSIYPSNATYKDIVWETSDEEIATVNQDGWVKPGVQDGQVTIRARHLPQNADDKEIYNYCTIEVAKPQRQITDMFTMVKVSTGAFTMGATYNNGQGAKNDEFPVHRASMSAFYISDTEVTQELYEAVMGDNPSYRINPQYPVNRVRWKDAMAFCEKLSALTGETYTLPTEAQWEYAARGGYGAMQTNYAGGINPDDVAWYQNNSSYSIHEVGTKTPNSLGLYDMSGNVKEWCLDYYDSYSADSSINPQGPSSGYDKVFRGGGCYSYKDELRVSARDYGSLGYCEKDLGFRIVRKL